MAAERHDEHLVVAELEHVRDLEPLVLAVHLEVAAVGNLAAAGCVERGFAPASRTVVSPSSGPASTIAVSALVFE